MTLPARVQAPVQPRRSAWAVFGSGVLLAAAGTIWWAFDADPGRGRVLLLVSLVVALAGYLFTRWPGVLPAHALAVAAGLIVLLAGYETWQAISTIVAQSGARLA